MLLAICISRYCGDRTGTYRSGEKQRSRQTNIDGPTRRLGKYETTDTGLYEFVTASDLPPEFPVVVHNGWYEFDLIGTRELMAAAVREGYFEVPRECTLTDLAETVDADKSTISGVLRRGESRLVKWFLAGSEQ